MRFGTYLAQHGLSVADAATQLEKPYATVLHWFHRRRTPRPAMQARIRDWSGGAVTGDDWLPAVDAKPVEAKPAVAVAEGVAA